MLSLQFHLLFELYCCTLLYTVMCNKPIQILKHGANLSIRYHCCNQIWSLVHYSVVCCFSNKVLISSCRVIFCSAVPPAASGTSIALQRVHSILFESKATPNAWPEQNSFICSFWCRLTSMIIHRTSHQVLKWLVWSLIATGLICGF